MLDVALQFLTNELNTYLLTRTGSDAVKAQLSAIVDDSGKYAFEKETLCASVINIEEERTLRTQLPQAKYIDGKHSILEPELKINLHLLFAANFKFYDQALKYISYVLTFFQSHSYFNSGTYPALDPRIAKLIVELQSLNYEQLNQVWAFVGGKQLPSVIYKVRMVLIQDTVQSNVQPPINVIDSVVHSR